MHYSSFMMIPFFTGANNYCGLIKSKVIAYPIFDNKFIFQAIFFLAFLKF